MDGINPELYAFAMRRVYGLADAPLIKTADPGGMPMGGAPAPAPAPAPGPPPGPPPGASGGMGSPPPGMAPPPMDPSGMAGMMGMPPQQPMQPQQQAGPPKMKPEQYMQMLDYRLYNIQQQLTAIMNHGGIQLPPEALVMPPGQPMAPPAESALPGSGSPVDQATQAQAQQQSQDPAAAGGGSAISAIEPIQGASPAGAQVKQSAVEFGEWLGAHLGTPEELHELAEILKEPEKTAGAIGVPFNIPAPPLQRRADALAAMYRSAREVARVEGAAA